MVSTTTADGHLKRLLVISHAAEMGGAEHALLDIARHYGARCHVLLFANGPLTTLLAAYGISYTILPAGHGVAGVRRESGWLRSLAAIPSAVRLTWSVVRMARHYDVLYPNSQKAAVIAMMAAWLVRRPVIWHMHDILSAEHFAPLQRWVITRLANLSARRVIVVSEAARQSFVKSGGDPARAVVVLNGVDPACFAKAHSTDAVRLRNELGVKDAPVVGHFGRITPWKGQEVLLKALPDLPGVHALIVGDALFGEDWYRSHLCRLAVELGVGDRVHWLGYRDDVPALMGIVDVVVHTSTSAEPFGRVIVEGMLASRPVLVADHGASRELLGHDSLALVPPGNAERLAAAVRTVLELPREARAALGVRNRARAETLFSLGAMLSNIDRVVALDGPA